MSLVLPNHQGTRTGRRCSTRDTCAPFVFGATMPAILEKPAPMSSLSFQFAKAFGIDDEAREVWGYASTETEDDDGQKVDLETLKGLLDEYMQWPSIWAQHQPDPVGICIESRIDAKGLFIRAHITDDAAWQKVKEGVFRGFSIRGPAQEVGNWLRFKRIREISLVDRPANPDCVFDAWKSSKISAHVEKVSTGIDEKENTYRIRQVDPKAFDRKSFRTIDIDKKRGIKAVIGKRPGKTTTEIQTYIFEKDQWTEGSAKKWIETHAKGAGMKTLEADVKKGFGEAAQIASQMQSLAWVQQSLKQEAQIEGDYSPLAAKAAKMIEELGELLKEVIDEETSEVLAGTDAASVLNGTAPDPATPSKEKSTMAEETDVQKAAKEAEAKKAKAFAGAMEAHKDAGHAVIKAHKDLAEAHKAFGEKMKEFGKAHKALHGEAPAGADDEDDEDDDEDDNGKKSVGFSAKDVQKAVSAALAAQPKMDIAGEVQKALAALPAAGKGAISGLGVIDKKSDNGSAGDAQKSLDQMSDLEVLKAIHEGKL